MHYANGREAKVGDKVVGKTTDGTPIGGVVCDAVPESDTFNLTVIPYPLNYIPITTASECLHVDDIGKPVTE